MTHGLRVPAGSPCRAGLHCAVALRSPRVDDLAALADLGVDE